MRILFIHGRAQERKDELILAQIWEDALKDSFNFGGFEYPKFEIDFPYYGNQLVELLEEYDEAIASGEYKMKGIPVDPAAEFEAELLADLAEGAGIDSNQALQEFGPEYLTRGPLNHKLPLYLIRFIDKYWRGAGNTSISIATRDVAAYLIVPLIRQTINDLIASKLTEEPTIVIAHSLGSVIAFDMLRDLPIERANIKGLITLGSPLGVRAVQRQFIGALKRPKCLTGDWLNIRDNLDIVSLNSLDNNHFNVLPPIENILMENISENHHGITEYLSNIEIAKFIKKCLF